MTRSIKYLNSVECFGGVAGVWLSGCKEEGREETVDKKINLYMLV